MEAGAFGVRWLQLVGMLHCVQAGDQMATTSTDGRPFDRAPTKSPDYGP